MKLWTTTIPIALATALILPQSAWSQSMSTQHDRDAWHEGIGGFLGGGVGYYRIDEQDFLNEDDDINDDRVSWKAFAGLDFGRIFALELAYIDFGELSEGPAALDATGWTAAGILSLPVTDNFAPYAKAGQLFWDADFTAGDVSLSDDGNDFFYGAGLRFALNDWSDIRLEYERFTMDDTDVDMASVNLQLSF